MTKLSNKEKFIKKAILRYGDLYNYSKVDYVNNITEVTIICPVHGEFLSTPRRLIKGSGCGRCNSENKFIEKAKEIHGDKYDYSKIGYNGVEEKITVMCKIHGEFSIQAKRHIGKEKMI